MALAHVRRGSGPPLALIHGIGSQWKMWEPVLDRVSAEREVVALDLPGFGDSAENGARPTMEALAGDVAEFLDGIGLGGAHVAGNSLGGAIALVMARQGAGPLGLPALARRLHQRPRGRLRAGPADGVAPPRASSATRTPSSSWAGRCGARSRSGTSPPGRGGSRPTRPSGAHAQPRPLPRLRDDLPGDRGLPLDRPRAELPGDRRLGREGPPPALLAPEPPRAAATTRTRGT